MASGKAVGHRMLADIAEPERARIVDEHAQHPAATGEVADSPVRLGIDPACDEALELSAGGIEDPQGGVARSGDVAGALQDLVEDGLRLELGEQASSHLDQAAQTILIQLVRVRQSVRPGTRLLDPPSLIGAVIQVWFVWVVV